LSDVEPHKIAEFVIAIELIAEINLLLMTQISSHPLLFMFSTSRLLLSRNSSSTRVEGRNRVAVTSAGAQPTAENTQQSHQSDTTPVKSLNTIASHIDLFSSRSREIHVNAIVFGRCCVSLTATFRHVQFP
jgi:hypothetical protein